ncbi:molybdenum cofactor biosynthesis protein MoaE [Candidatus Poriferisodalis sp.]|uniref:molybdenum cofactor biosynthesis protein MoaE n=1 Tax=Candidatus Poriferisodalis sp. TaxID=3101277 RepID=UPI003B0141DA
MTVPSPDARMDKTSDQMHGSVQPVDALSPGDIWVELAHDELPITAVYQWALDPAAGAVVLFSGTVRDHADHRTGVTQLVYEAYEAEVAPRLSEIAAEMRRRWPSVCKAALLHRVGTLGLTESSVVVAVSAPHREAAFEAARFGIDTLKSTVPIWKQEHHAGGTDWGLQSQPIAEVPRS